MGRIIRAGKKAAVLFTAGVVGMGLLAGQAAGQGSRTAALHKAMAGQNHAEARKLAEAMLKSANQGERVAASLAYGRVLLSQGERDAARQYLAFMEKLNLEADVAQRIQVYAAWLAALDGNAAEAIKTLEQMLVERADGAATAEAADVLAQLYLARSDRAAAKKAVDFGLGFLKYQDIKHPYLESLLKSRLAARADEEHPEARKLYEQAEKLRREGKPADAGKRFTELRAGYPQTIWADAAGYRIGQCLLALGRTAQAAEYWIAFADHQPAGPWRGQARVALVDLALCVRTDLPEATRHADAAVRLIDKIDDPRAEPSWREAAFDVHLRHGLVALFDRRAPAAAESFRHARGAAEQRKPAAGDRLLAGLDRLIHLAERNLAIVPDELAVGETRLTLPLAAGTIFNLLGLHEQALGAFDQVLSGSASSALRPHRSFAALGKARATIGLGHGETAERLAAARPFYELSLAQRPDASWHDETRRELALLIEDLAQHRADASGTQARAALEAARSEALPHWQAIIDQFPQSPRLPQALYHAGVLYAESAKPDAERSAAAFEQLTKKFPASPWTGDAHVRLIDVKLERQFDLPGAAAHARAAVDWLETIDPEAVARSRRALGATTEASPLPQPGGGAVVPALRETTYDIYVRAGLVAYLQGRADEAAAFFEKAKPLESGRRFVVAYGHVPTGIERLIEVAKSDESLTAEEARRGDTRAGLTLQLADVYHAGKDHAKAMELLDLVIGARSGVTDEQRSWALFKRGRNRYSLGLKDRDASGASADYRAAASVAPKASWAGMALLLSANITFNVEGDVNRAVQQWRWIIQNYPDFDEAHRCAYYIGVAYEAAGRPREARHAYEEFMQKFPDSPFVRLVRSVHLKRVDALERALVGDEGP